MAVRQIRIYGDPCLRQKSLPVEDFGAELAVLLRDMTDTMYDSRGIGLAAPQIGVNLRVCVVDVDWVSEESDQETGQRNLRVFINPEIVWESPNDCMMKEGCLSLPEIEGEVYRPGEIRLRWRDEQGQPHERAMEAIEARCVQHELDHLDGVLFVDRMPFVKRRLLAGKLRLLKEKTAEVLQTP